MSSTGVLPAKAEEATTTPSAAPAAVASELDLRSIVDGTPRLDELSTARLVGQIAAAVQAAKAAGKPTELTLETIKVKVADGAVEAALGTFAMAYASPERAKGVTTDRKSDVFSLGIVLWEALTHARLFAGAGADDAATAKAILAGGIKPASQLNANVPAELDAICKKALAADPADRYQSPKVMAAEIDAVLDDAGYPEDNSQIAAHVQKLAAAAAKPAPAATKKDKEHALPSPKVAPKITTAAPPNTASTPAGSMPSIAARPNGTNPPPTASASPAGTLPGMPMQKPATIPPPMTGAATLPGLPPQKPATIPPPMSTTATTTTPEPGSVTALGSTPNGKSPATKSATPEPGTVAAIGSAKSTTTPPATKTPEPGSVAAIGAAKSTTTPEPGSIAAVAKPTPISSKQTMLGHAPILDPVPAAPIVPKPPTLPPPIANEELKTTPFVRDDVLAAPKIAVGQIPGLDLAAAPAAAPPPPLTKIEPVVAAVPAPTPPPATPRPKPGEVPILVEATKRAPTAPVATDDAGASGVHPASIVSLPRHGTRDGTGKHDVLSSWAWTGEAPEGFADEDFHAGDDEGRRRKLLMYGIAGGVGVVLIICLFAFGFGGSKKPAAEDDKAVASAPKATEFKPTNAAGSAPAPATTQPDPTPTPPTPPPTTPPPPPVQQDVAPPTPPAPPVTQPEVKAPDPTPPPPPPLVKQPDPPKKEPAVVKKDPPKKDPPKKTEPKKAEPKKVAAGPVDPYAEPKSAVDPAEAYRKGLQQYARGDTSGALATFKSSMQANSGYAPTYRGLGLVYEKMGNHSMARAAFKRYLALAPNASDADGIRERMEKL